MPNPYYANVYGGVPYYVACYSNAMYLQRVTITPPSGVNGGNAVFQGSGEGNITMALNTPGFLTRGVTNGQAYFTAPGSFSNMSVYQVRIQYSSNNGSTWTDSDVYGSAWMQSTTGNGANGVISMVSEDSTDADYNDAVCVFTFYKTNTA